MTNDIVTILREIAERALGRTVDNAGNCIPTRAADEIERLRADRDNWREASERIAHDLEKCDDEIERLRAELKQTKQQLEYERTMEFD